MSISVSFISDVSATNLASDYGRVMATAFGHSPSHWAGLYSRKHEKNPFGPSSATLVMESGKIAAMNFFWKWRFVKAGKHLNAAQSCDSVVLPEFRNRGLFSAMQLRAVEEIPADVLCYGLPQENSASGLAKAGYVLCPEYRIHIAATRLARFVVQRVIAKRKAFRSVPLDADDAQRDEQLDEFLCRTSRSSPSWTTDYSRDLIDWKLGANPEIRMATLLGPTGISAVMLYQLSELIDDPTYRLLAVIDLIAGEAPGVRDRVTSWLRASLAKNSVSEIQTASTIYPDYLGKVGWRVMSKSGRLYIHPRHGLGGHQDIGGFLEEASITPFATDHL